MWMSQLDQHTDKLVNGKKKKYGIKLIEKKSHDPTLYLT